jgi:6-phosphogluconolactonase
MTDERRPARRVTIVADAAALSYEAAEAFARRAEQSVAARGVFRIVLSGGATPRGLYDLLARDDAPFRARVPWARTEVFWGDERPVPPDHRDSNYRMARESLLAKVPVPAANIHRIHGEAARAEDAAREYESTLRSLFAPTPDERPAFDLVLLGLGPDGHTASLFPGSDAMHERHRLVIAPWVEKLGAHRITLTPKAINAAALVLFLVSGPEKAPTLAAVIEGEERPFLLPAQAIRPERGELLFIVDRAAAGRLRE